MDNENNGNIQYTEEIYYRNRYKKIARIEKHLMKFPTNRVELESYESPKKMFIQELSLSIFEKTVDERTLEYECPKPNFFDWLFGRKRKVKFEFKAKDLLLQPVERNDERVYFIREFNKKDYVQNRVD